MSNSLLYQTSSLVISLTLLVLMLVFYTVGHALNDMINSISTRRTSREITIPSSILWLLFLLCLASSFIVGYGSRKKTDWVLVTGFALMVTVAVFSILDLDHPHSGLITLDNVEMNILELKSLFDYIFD